MCYMMYVSWVSNYQLLIPALEEWLLTKAGNSSGVAGPTKAQTPTAPSRANQADVLPMCGSVNFDLCLTNVVLARRALSQF